MTVAAHPETSLAFELFKAVLNAVCDPRVSFALAVVLFAAGMVVRWVWKMWVGWAFLVVTALAMAWGWRDPHFSGHDMLGKADNLPIVMMIFIFGWALWFAMSQAINNDRRLAEKLPPEEAESSRQKTWCWPDLVYIEFLSMIVCMIVLIVWSVMLPAPLEEPANPGVTPNPSKAPWYFLGLQEMLVYFDPWMAGVVLPILIIFGLCAIPYVDINPKGAGYYAFAERRFAIGTFIFGFLVLWVFMILTGTFLRGPGWNFFGPFEHWDAHKVVPLNNVDLSELFWINIAQAVYRATGIEWFNQGVPVVHSTFPWRDWGNFFTVLKKEWLGIAFLLFWFGVLPALILKVFRPAREYLKQAGFIRYSIVVLLFLTMMTLPLKMVGRWVINLKYIVNTPWVKF